MFTRTQSRRAAFVAAVAQVRVHAVPNIFEGPETVVRPAIGARVRF
jgi:hypothetical protein